MYCKYCGKSIDNDSIYCSYCGRKIGEEEDISKHLSKFCSPSKKMIKSTRLSRTRITKEQFIGYLNLIWKVIKTIVIAIVGLIVYIFVGLIMSPFIALFNAEIPSLGFFDKIETIWKKEKNNEDKSSEEIINVNEK
jgi:uncharacterized membrane protein YvbJ